LSQELRQSLRVASAHFLTLYGPTWSGFTIGRIINLGHELRYQRTFRDFLTSADHVLH